MLMLHVRQHRGKTKVKAILQSFSYIMYVAFTFCILGSLQFSFCKHI